MQDITEEDAISEGITKGQTYYQGEPHAIKGSPKCYNTAKEAFKGLWNHINAKRGYGWDTNPFVWIIEFRRLQKIAIDPFVIGDTKIQTDKGILSGKRVDPNKEDAVLGLEVM